MHKSPHLLTFISIVLVAVVTSIIAAVSEGETETGYISIFIGIFITIFASIVFSVFAFIKKVGKLSNFDFSKIKSPKDLKHLNITAPKAEKVFQTITKIFEKFEPTAKKTTPNTTKTNPEISQAINENTTISSSAIASSKTNNNSEKYNLEQQVINNNQLTQLLKKQIIEQNQEIQKITIDQLEKIARFKSMLGGLSLLLILGIIVFAVIPFAYMIALEFSPSHQITTILEQILHTITTSFSSTPDQYLEFINTNSIFSNTLSFTSIATFICLAIYKTKTLDYYRHQFIKNGHQFFLSTNDLTKAIDFLKNPTIKYKQAIKKYGEKITWFMIFSENYSIGSTMQRKLN